MKAYLAKSFIGILVTDEQGKVILYRKFPKDPKKIISLLESAEVEKKLVGELKKKGYDEVIAEYDVEGAKVEFPNIAGIVLRRDLENIAIKNGFVKSKKELRRLLQKVAISICAERFRKLPRDRVAIQVVLIDRRQMSRNPIQIMLTKIIIHSKFRLSPKICSASDQKRSVFPGGAPG